jgi:PPK2 family polyphosphate:nucleotide phosphotransferase
MARSIRELLRADPAGADLTALPTAATPGFNGSKSDGKKALAGLGRTLGELQERLFAESRGEGTRSLLLVLQGMDTSGKSGATKHVVGQVNPIGVHYVAFKAPTAEERRHDFLWRVKKHLPPPGILAVFDRSHYEDVVVVRVHNLVEPRTWRRRYATINRFEEELVAGGTTVVKCFLHISKEEQRERLLARLDDPTKYWKYNPADVDERLRWPDYMAAYSDAINETNTEIAPWYIVASDRKWWRNIAICRLLIETLEGMSPQYPAADFDPAHERQRLLSS